MDTAILQNNSQKNCAFYAIGGVFIFLTLSCITTITFAKEFNHINLTGISPDLSHLINIQTEFSDNFDNKTKNKYSGGKITDIEEGVKHIKTIRYYNDRPVRLNIIEISTNVNPNLSIIPSTASNTLASKSKISSIAKRENAIVAINGGYFKPQTGVPLGTLMINKKFYTGPIYNRVAMGIFDDGYDMARIKLKASINTNIGDLKIDNVNQPRMLSTHTIVYTPDWGKISPPTPKYGSQLVVENNKIIKVTQNSCIIPENGFVIVGPSKKINLIKNAKQCELNLKTSPGWKDVNHIISGGPYLVKNNEIFVDMTEQKLSAIGGRNPRTAIGYTKENNLILLTADGREDSSIGLTLIELAQLMKEYECVNAMNLDGGGSTVMYVKGNVVNKPAVQGGIPLSHTLMVNYKKS
ncbi:phosphodiester glycosidase family protein [bacterium]|nr:phosphodiester glycosidase family protein [bacterium]